MQHKRLFLIVGAIIVIIILISGYLYLRHQGYAFFNGRIIHTATINVVAPISGTKVFVDQYPSGEAKTDGETITSGGILPGRHNILIAKDGYWPWSKVIDFNEGNKVTIHPFLVARSLELLPVAADSQTYQTLRQEISKKTLPKVDKPLTSANGQTKLWADGQNIVVQKTDGTPQIIFTTMTPITGLDFYKGRDDVAIVGTERRLMAIELNIDSVQNAEPIFDAKVDGFYDDTQANLLYILVGKAVFGVKL